jgi:hypothetical protein
MTNAYRSLKATAADAIDSNDEDEDEDGVAKWLKEYAL